MRKICSKCLIEKDLSEFHRLKNTYRSECKQCRKISTANYRVKNREKLNKKQKDYYQNNKKSRDEYRKKWIENNKDKIKNYTKTSNLKRKEYKKEYNKKYREKHKDKVKNWDKNRRLKYPHISAWRRLLSETLKRLSQKKEDETIKLLGYSANQLKEHITRLFTENMTWENYGEWHIDHIKPVSKFPKDTHPSIVNALSNLQPLWKTTREINGVVYKGNLNKWAN